MPSEETRAFTALYSPNPGDEIIPWIGDSGVGFSIFRQYPTDVSFVPAKTADGRSDSICLIKIGFSTGRNHVPDRIPLFVSVSKESRYLLNNHWNFNFEDDDSPTKDSLEESKKSRQPVELGDDAYYYDQARRLIYSAETNMAISVNQIVDNIYSKHLKTIKFSGTWFRLKLFLRDTSTKPVEFVKELSLGFLRRVLDKTVQTDIKKDMWEGAFRPYRHSHLYTLATEQIDVFGTGIMVPKKSALVSGLIVVIATVWFAYANKQPLWWTELKQQSQIVQAAFLLIIIWMVDFVLPHLILSGLNLLIRFRNRMMNWRIKIR